MRTPSSPADESLPPGVRPLKAEDPGEIGGYPLLGRLGHGGMGIAYLGRDPRGRLVAVKSAYREMADEESTRRYEAEAACLRRAPAAYVAPLVADGSAHEPPYVVTEYIAGRSLAQAVNADGPLRGTALRALAVGVARALAAVHQAGLVHRDVKPANIVLSSTGPRLIDFGIAQQVGDAGGPTEPGLVVGSPGWIPPERLDRRPATAASDVFGWGCVVGFAGTGRNPFGTGDPDVLAHRTAFDLPDLDRLEDSLRGPVAQALSKDPGGRPASAELLAWLDWAGAVYEPPGEPSASADDPGIPHTGDVDVTPPGGAPVPADDGADGRPSTKDLPVGSVLRRWAPAPVAVALMAAVALIAVLMTAIGGRDRGDPGRTPPVGPPTTAPSNAAATWGANPPHRRTAPSGGSTARRSTAQTSPANASGQHGDKGKGGNQGKDKSKASGKGPGSG